MNETEAMHILNDMVLSFSFSMSKKQRDAVEIAVQVLSKNIPEPVVKGDDFNPSTCPSCGRELSCHIGDGIYEDSDFLGYCPNDKCHQKLLWT